MTESYVPLHSSLLTFIVNYVFYWYIYSLNMHETNTSYTYCVHVTSNHCISLLKMFGKIIIKTLLIMSVYQANWQVKQEVLPTSL